MSEDKNQQKTGKQLLNDTQEAAERAQLLRQMNPTSAQLETELKHEKRKHSYNRALRSTLYTLLVVAAVAVLIATMVMPILQISGTSLPKCPTGSSLPAIKYIGSFKLFFL